MVVVTLAPLVAVSCYFAGVRFDTGREPPAETPRKVIGFGKYALLIQVIVFTTTLIFVRALSNIGIWGETRTNFTGMMELSVGELAIISLTILLLTYLVFDLPSKRFSLSLRCIIGFVAILGSLQILALSGELQFGSGFDAITTAAELFSHLVRWMIIIECVRSIDMPPYRIAGISNPIYAILSIIWIHMLAPLSFTTSAFVMMIIYVLFLIIIVLFVRESFSRDTSLWKPQTTDKRDDFADFARRSNLSARETEIFCLLMLGRKRAEIEAECDLSEGTVKTHISNIYRKLDVHSKREMRQYYEADAQSRAPAENAE
jgi:DNA-binding CsgD family transcriptional regulator